MKENNSNLTLKAKLSQPPKIDFWFIPSFSFSNLFVKSSTKVLKIQLKKNG